jgi:DNA repair protein RecO (recombination protein O)
MRRRVDNEPGFVLHSYPYKETSLIVEAFTRQHGRVGLLARGARRPRSATRGVLLAFHPLRLSWSATGELGTLVAAEWSSGRASLAGIGLMCGFYLNELMLRLLPRADPHERLFDHYAQALARLGGGEEPAPVLRAFERRLLAELGYAPSLERDAASGAPIDPARRYRFEPEHGFVAAGGAAAAGVSGRTLLCMAADDYREATTREEARPLLRELISQRLGGQILHTREILLELEEL